MKRSSVVLSTVLGTFFFACEDGPKDTYKPLPAGAGQLINAGDPQAYVDPATKSFQEDTSGTNVQNICTPSERRAALSLAFRDPIIPAKGTATVDLTAGGVYDPPLVISDLEKKDKLCRGGGGGGTSTFGDAAELRVRWSSQTRRVDQVSFWPGYRGTLEIDSMECPGTAVACADSALVHSHYSIGTSEPIKKDGVAMEISWASGAARTKWTTDVYNAVIAQYAAELHLPRETNCAAAGKCIINTSFVTSAYLWIIPTGTTIWVNNPSDPRSANIFARIEQTLVKVSPFSTLPVRLEIDADGANVHGIVGNGHECNISYGVTWGDFINNCVKVYGTARDDAEYRKLLTSLSHDQERFNFGGVFGTRMYFQNVRLQGAADKDRFDVTRDDELPTADAKGVYLRIDQNTLGEFANDYENGDTRIPGEGCPATTPNCKKDNHGHGLQQLAFAIMVQEELNKFIPANQRHFIGDPACASHARGCTGMEGYITAARPEKVDPSRHPYARNVALGGPRGGFALTYLSSIIGHGFKPAVHGAYICDSPRSLDGCVGGTQWSTVLGRVQDVMGKGINVNLPAEFRDARGFAKLWFKALIKYLIAFGADPNKDPSLQDVLAVQLKPNQIFFDGQNFQFDRAEYDIHQFVSGTAGTPDYRAPLNVEVVWDAFGGIMNSYQFASSAYRGELAFFTSLIDVPGDPPGKSANALATNVFGSKVLNDNWVAARATATTFKTPYACATADIDDGPGGPAALDFSLAATGTVAIPAGPHFMQAFNDCGVNGVTGLLNLPPLVADPVSRRYVTQRDDAGDPVLKAYRGAFRGEETIWNLAKPIGQIKESPLTVTETYPLLRAAKVQFPLYNTPYNPPRAESTGMLVSLVTHIPPSDSTGFSIPINSTRSKFIKGTEIDFTGQTFDGNINLVPEVDAFGNATGKQLLVSLETDEYDGEVFLCRDVGGDILSVRMFDTDTAILDWIFNHPNNRCNFVVQYYADHSASQITSLANGVTVTFTFPRGGARVADCELFSPGQ